MTPSDLTCRERLVLGKLLVIRNMTAARAGDCLEAVGLVTGGSPSNRCLPGASVLHALRRRGLADFTFHSGTRWWFPTRAGEALAQELPR